MTIPADTLRPLAEADLPLVRSWRNHPSVRQHMFSTHAIAEDEHRQWFARQQADPTRRLWLFLRGGQPMGFVHLSGVAPGGVAEWGFYAAPGAPKGTGRALGLAALARAFGTEQPAQGVRPGAGRQHRVAGLPPPPGLCRGRRAAAAAPQRRRCPLP
jgi:RimJ/RimL family protein N-acetyltransferase